MSIGGDRGKRNGRKIPSVQNKKHMKEQPTSDTKLSILDRFAQDAVGASAAIKGGDGGSRRRRGSSSSRRRRNRDN